MFTHIIHYDWLMLKANRIWLTSFALLIFFVAFALWNGARHVAFQQRTLADIHITQHRALDSLRQTVRQMEVGAPFVGEYWDAPDYTYGIGAYKSQLFTTLPTARLGIVAFGQSDLRPYYYKVTMVKKQAMYHSEEIASASILYNGNFDLAFVIVYLLPLLIIALSYDLVSSEKEQGTLPLLLTGQTPLREIVLVKYLFRFLLFNGVLLGLVTAGLLLSGVHLQGAIDGLLMLMLVTMLYTAFWFSFSFLVNSLGRNSGYNAALLVGTWLVVVLLLPTFLSALATQMHPMPSRTELITQTRQATDRAEKQSSQLLSRYFHDHPDLIPKDQPINFNDWSIGALRRQLEIDQAIEPLEASFEAQLAHQQDLIDRYRLVSPAIFVQQTLNRIAGTDQNRYADFGRQTLGYYKKLQGFFHDKIFRHQKFPSSEFGRIPRFHYQEPESVLLDTATGINLVFLGLVTGCLTVLGFVRLHKISLETA